MDLVVLGKTRYHIGLLRKKDFRRWAVPYKDIPSPDINSDTQKFVQKIDQSLSEPTTSGQKSAFHKGVGHIIRFLSTSTSYDLFTHHELLHVVIAEPAYRHGTGGFYGFRAINDLTHSQTFVNSKSTQSLRHQA